MRNIKLYTFTKYLEATLDQLKILKLTNIARNYPLSQFIFLKQIKEKFDQFNYIPTSSRNNCHDEKRRKGVKKKVNKENSIERSKEFK